jgi:hypothetical protein
MNGMEDDEQQTPMMTTMAFATTTSSLVSALTMPSTFLPVGSSSAPPLGTRNDQYHDNQEDQKEEEEVEEEDNDEFNPDVQLKRTINADFESMAAVGRPATATQQSFSEAYLHGMEDMVRAKTSSAAAAAVTAAARDGGSLSKEELLAAASPNRRHNHAKLPAVQEQEGDNIVLEELEDLNRSMSQEDLQARIRRWSALDGASTSHTSQPGARRWFLLPLKPEELELE